jgi:hypothetical protein
MFQHDKPKTGDPASKKQTGQAAGQSPKPGTLADAHGKGVAGTSTYDLTGHLGGTEGSLGSQSGPQPSGGATGMREQLGSFEAGQSDTSGIPGEDRRRDPRLPGEDKLPK